MRSVTALLCLALLYPVTTGANEPEGESAATAIFAGGCFWCMESDFQDRDGILDVVSGFTGGKMQNPTYSGDHRGHYEAVKITYDPTTVSYEELLQHYWKNVDPFDDGGQFCDRGPSYRPAIFAQEGAQRTQAEASRAAVVARFPEREVVTPVLPAQRFWPVEEYHQDYYLKNPVRYKYYRWSCGRDDRLAEIWGKS